MSAIALPVLLLGLMTLLGTSVYLLACRHLPEEDVPACCRRRVSSFAAHAQGTAVTATSLTTFGVVLLLADLG